MAEIENAGPPVLITGLHRSGTTWVGRIVEETGALSVLHEPFNLQHGLRGVPCWYPYHPGGRPDPAVAPHAATVETLTGAFFAGRARYVRGNSKSGPVRKLARALLGNRSERTYRAVFRNGPGRVCLKDPFCLFFVPHLVETRDIRAVVMMRHPAALLVSMRRMGWWPHMGILREQPGLLERYGADMPASVFEDGADDIATNGWFWKIAARWTRNLVETYPDNVLCVRHEDLSRGSTGELEAMLDHAGLGEAMPAARAFLERSTQGRTVAPERGVLHEFERNGAALASLWQRKLDAREQARLRDIVGEEAEAFYG